MTGLLRLGLSLGLALACAAPVAGRAAHRGPWWQGALLYEVYPRSFADTDGDGTGDLPGITRHLDDLQWLGVDAVWIAPIYPSPQVDFGYDISDYRAIDRRYGTMADFARLQREARRRGIRVIVDMVLNHTSDRHAWFEESATSRTNAKADWYVWNDGLPADAPGLGAVQKANVHDGRVPPNNWTSFFGGSSWQWVPARRQFYYHKFYVQQPDLNWRSPAVERAMMGVLRFWLDQGVAGFRLDALPHLYENAALRDEPEAGGTDAFGLPRLRHVHTDNLPEVHGVLRRMRKLVDGYGGDRVLIGENYLPDTATLDTWYGGVKRDELQLPMDLLPGFGEGARYAAAWFRPLLAASQTDLHGAMPLFVFDNHDQVRSIDRFGDGTHDQAIAKGVATILLASRATALTYYGAPLGMRTRTPTRREDVRDPVGIAGWPRDKGRDGERTPMQWTAGPQAGFSTNPATWLPIDPNYRTINVATQRAMPDSLLNWHRNLIALRRANPALRGGTMAMLGDDPQVLAWTRTSGTAQVVVAINMGSGPRTIRPARLGSGVKGDRFRTLAASERASAAGGVVTLPPFASWIGEAVR